MEHQPAQAEGQDTEHEDGDGGHPTQHADNKGVDQEGAEPADKHAARQQGISGRRRKILLQELAHGRYLDVRPCAMQDK